MKTASERLAHAKKSLAVIQMHVSELHPSALTEADVELLDALSKLGRGLYDAESAPAAKSLTEG